MRFGRLRKGSDRLGKSPDKGKDISNKETEHETQVCVFYHPSGANLARYFTRKIFDILNQ